MANKIDLTGEKLFSWIVKKEAKSDSRGALRWICECENCKKIKNVKGQHFRNKQIEPCECIKFDKMVAKIFGKLITIEIYKYNQKNQPYWLCKCECGKYKVIRESHLIDGSTISCGCHRIKLHQDKFRYRLINKKFGYWTVIKFDHKVRGRIHWLCRCECGTEKSVCGSQLKKGKSLSCGCKNNISRGEEKISDILNKYNIKHNRQQTFKNCKSIKSLKFDFYLPEHNLCIEFQGIQHYKEIDKYNGLKQRQLRDQIKREFCKKNNIELLEISYLDIKNIEDIIKRATNLSP